MSEESRMTRNPRQPRKGSASRSVYRFVLIAGCACTLLLGGCQRDPADEALDQASIRLASLDVGLGTHMPPQLTRDKLHQIITDMEPLIAASSPQAGDASVLLAMAQRGLALQDSADLAQRERELVNLFPKTRARLHAWVMNNATATATATYDPTPEFDDIASQVLARQKDIATQEARAKEIESQISNLLEQVSTRLGHSADLRKQAGALKLQIPDVSATEGLALAKQVRELGRQADTIEFEARDIKNKTDQLRLDDRAVIQEIKKLKIQIGLLSSARSAVEKRAQQAEKTAAQARGLAQLAGDAISELLESPDTGIIGLRESLDTDYDPIISQLETATRSARSGTTARRSSAQRAIGQIQQSLGDVHFAHALGLESYANLLDEITDATPALPNAAQYADRASQAKEAAIQARTHAFDAYTAALSAYEATGARGDVKDLIDQANNKLRELAGRVGAGAVDAQALEDLQNSMADETAPDKSQADSAAANDSAIDSGDEEAALRQAIQTATDAFKSGDTEAGIAFIEPATDADAAIVDRLGSLATSSSALDAATEAAFGEKFTQWAKSNAPANANMGAMNPDDLLGDDLKNLDIRIQGDQAVAISSTPNVPDIKFRKVDGQWKMVLDMADMMSQSMPAGLPPDSVSKMIGILPDLFDAQAVAFSELAQEVKDGTLESNQAVAVKLQTKLQPVMTKLMQSMMPSGGG